MPANFARSSQSNRRQLGNHVCSCCASTSLIQQQPAKMGLLVVPVHSCFAANNGVVQQCTAARQGRHHINTHKNRTGSLYVPRGLYTACLYTRGRMTEFIMCACILRSSVRARYALPRLTFTEIALFGLLPFSISLDHRRSILIGLSLRAL